MSPFDDDLGLPGPDHDELSWLDPLAWAVDAVVEYPPARSYFVESIKTWGPTHDRMPEPQHPDLTMAEKSVLLAAIRDARCDPDGQLDPYPDSEAAKIDESTAEGLRYRKAAIGYCALVRHRLASDWKPVHFPALVKFLRQVVMHLRRAGVIDDAAWAAEYGELVRLKMGAAATHSAELLRSESTAYDDYNAQAGGTHHTRPKAIAAGNPPGVGGGYAHVALADADAEHEAQLAYSARRPALAKLVAVVVDAVRPGETALRERHERDRSGSWADDEWQSIRINLHERTGPYPQYGIPRFAIRTALREQFPGITDDDVDLAIREAQERGSIRTTLEKAPSWDQPQIVYRLGDSAKPAIAIAPSPAADEWRRRPFDPTCADFVKRDPAVVMAIQCVLKGWDGNNWDAVRAVLVTTQVDAARIAEMSVDEIRQRFAVGQMPMIATLGGRPHTTDATVQDLVLPEREAVSPSRPGDQSAAPANGDTTNTGAATMNTMERRAKWLGMAMLLVKDHPEWSDREIARRVEINRSQLSRSAEYKVVAQLARDQGATPHKGHLTKDDDGRSGVIAYARNDSRYAKGICRECGESILVRPGTPADEQVCDPCKTD